MTVYRYPSDAVVTRRQEPHHVSYTGGYMGIASRVLCLMIGLTVGLASARAASRGNSFLFPARLLRSKSSSASSSTNSADFKGAGVPQDAEATFTRLFKMGDERPIVLFDGICIWCNTNVDFLARLDANRQLRWVAHTFTVSNSDLSLTGQYSAFVYRFASLQSDVGRDLLVVCGRAPDDLSSMVVLDSSRKFFLKSDAVLRIAEAVAPFPWLGSSVKAVAGLLMPRLVRDSAYDLMADNRYSLMGKRDSCRLPDPDDNRFVK